MTACSPELRPRNPTGSTRTRLPRRITYSQRCETSTSGAVEQKRRQSTLFCRRSQTFFLQAVQGHRLAAMWTCILLLGLRRSEACGLRWSDVNLDKHTIRCPRCTPSQGPPDLTTHQNSAIEPDRSPAGPLRASPPRVLERTTTTARRPRPSLD